MKTAFVFAGQGAQKVKMGEEFFKKSPTVYPDIEQLILEGTQEQLNQTENTQKAISLTSITIAKEVLKKVQPDCVFGLSLGEYNALWCAGVLCEEDLLDIVTQRGTLMQEALADSDSGMLAVMSSDIDLIKELTAQHHCWVSNYNAPNQTVISGLNTHLESLKEAFKTNSIRFIPLRVSGAFHSHLLEEASIKLNKILKTKEFKPQQIPVLFNLSASTQPDDEIIDALTGQLYHPVDFVGCVQSALDMGINQFIEIGPGTTTAGLIKKISPDSNVLSINSLSDLEKIQ